MSGASCDDHRQRLGQPRLARAPAAIAEGVAEAYGVTAEVRERAYDWHRLGPWYEVGYGIETEQPDFVESGLSGVLKRL